jgi:uncharacterized phage protein (TIGR01671 family)
MREIKFRGKAKYDGQWVYGTLRLREGMNYAIIEEFTGLGHDVPKDTVGEYIGLKDKNGKEIYESDLLKHNNNVYKVIWTHGGFGLVNVKNELEYSSLHDIDLRTEKNPDGFEIIGNIWENPELLTK